jgi:hypothetical protein
MVQLVAHPISEQSVIAALVTLSGADRKLRGRPPAKTKGSGGHRPVSAGSGDSQPHGHDALGATAGLHRQAAKGSPSPSGKGTQSAADPPEKDRLRAGNEAIQRLNMAMERSLRALDEVLRIVEEEEAPRTVKDIVPKHLSAARNLLDLIEREANSKTNHR